VSLHSGASPEAAWENVVTQWFEKIAPRGLHARQPATVVTASRNQAFFFRSRLLAEGKSLMAVKFLSPSQLRALLLRRCDLQVPLRRHLRLLPGVPADGFPAPGRDDA